MSLAKKLKKWEAFGFISQEQADKIGRFENTFNSEWILKTLFWLSGSLIGFGLILIVGANWDSIPMPIKFVGDFILFGACLYGVYQSIEKKHSYWAEMFLMLAFLMVGATIGLIGQSFNLEGGWRSFALAWALLSLPFALMSRLKSLNVAWVILLASSFLSLDDLEDLIFKLEFYGLVILVFLCAAASYGSYRLAEMVKNRVVLFQALARTFLLTMYVMLFVSGCKFGIFSDFLEVRSVLAKFFVLTFLGICMLLAFKRKDIKSFRNNALLLELYICFLFLSSLHDMLVSGIGFIIGGLLILGLIFVGRRTLVYIKNMQGFKKNV